jgi:serine/threonine protein kinase
MAESFESAPSKGHGTQNFPQPFGRYTLLSKLGAGGMADAMLAMLDGAHGFQKPVVIKRMHASLGSDEYFVKMFLDEAKLAARLHHNHVVATSEVGSCDGHYFIAMEYLEGVSLDRIARHYVQSGQQVPFSMLLQVVSDCLVGLHYAHELRDFDGSPLQVVHRDVSPSNLFVTSSGVSKVLDFGIAKAATQDQATRTGMLKGKLAYMSPEQFYSAPIDHRSDVWSMGIVLWEMTTGRRLFKGTNDALTYRNIVGAEIPPVGEYRPDVPEELNRVIAGALARDREQRTPSADVMRRQLADIQQRHAPTYTREEMSREIVQQFSTDFEESRESIRAFSRRQKTLALVPTRKKPDDDLATMVDEKIPDDIRASWVSSPPPPRMSAPKIADDPSLWGTQPETEVAREKITVQSEKSQTWIVQAIGWITVLFLVLGAGWLVVRNRDFIERGLRDLASGREPDPARVGTFILRLESDPPGATVHEGEVNLGPAPLEIPVLRGSVAEQPRVFVFSLPGYASQNISQETTLLPRVTQHVRLVRDTR